MNAVFLINDGQHRKAAILDAIKEDPTLSDETIAIVFFKDEGLERSQQMFADLNKHAVKSTMSLSTLYDDRDPMANAVKQVVSEIPFLNKYIDKEKDALGKNSSKLFTLANFLRANKRIIKEEEISQEIQQFLTTYWKEIFSNISEWQLLESKQIYKCTLKEEYILTLSVTLNAFGRLGKYFSEHVDELFKLKELDNIDWSRVNSEWIGRAISAQGKIINNEDSIVKICNFIKKSLGLTLSKEEMVKENDIRR
jgi:DNA sulfur modification protein DndB